MDESDIAAIANAVPRERKGKIKLKFKKHGRIIKGVSVHAFHRYEERIGKTTGMKSEVENALRRGKTWYQIKPGPLQDYVRGVTHNQRKLILCYQGSIYVFGAPKRRKPRQLVTIWPLSEGLAKEWDKEARNDGPA